MGLTTHHHDLEAYSVQDGGFITITAPFAYQRIKVSPDDLLSILHLHAPGLFDGEPEDGEADRIP